MDSELVQIVLQYGCIGTIIYILMLLSPIYIYIKSKNKKILAFYPSILAIILINNISNTSLILFDTAIGIYILIGLLFIQEPEEGKMNKKNIIFNTTIPLWSMNNKSRRKSLL